MLIIITISLLTLYFIGNRPIYGNDENGIIKVISKDDRFKNESSIKIFAIIDIGNSRLVGYYYNNLTCIANFTLNEQSNYVISDKQWSGSPVQHYPDNLIDADYEKAIFVYNGKDNLSKIKIELDGENYALIERDIEPDKPSIVVIDLEDFLKNKDSYSYKCWYYDSSGNELEW